MNAQEFDTIHLLNATICQFDGSNLQLINERKDNIFSFIYVNS